MGMDTGCEVNLGSDNRIGLEKNGSKSPVILGAVCYFRVVLGNVTGRITNRRLTVHLIVKPLSRCAV